jgi:hypothetical protein
MSFPKPKRIVDEALLEFVRTLPCSVCGRTPGGESFPITVSHIKTRGSGGDDAWYNCVPKCTRCHREWEDSAPKKFCGKYPRFEKLLFRMGWEWLGQKLFHPNMTKDDEENES